MPLKQTLVLDIGNTSTRHGLFRGKQLKKHGVILTSQLKRGSLKGFKRYKHSIDQIVICSVVPQVHKRIRPLWQKYFGCPVRILGKHIPLPIPNKTFQPSRVGKDRLVNAWAAYQLYKSACIVVDFGTAITIDLVSNHGEFLGGTIAPGINMSIQALSEKTALLPKIKFKPVRSSIGKTTEECINAGCSIGLGGLCDGIIGHIQREKGQRFPVVATGGYASSIKRHCRKIDSVRPYLTLEGIYGISQSAS